MKLVYLLIFSVLAVGRVLALPNPAAAYCEKLGYEYKKVQTAEGTRGIAVVEPGVEFDAWDFFKGKVGNEYSFGALCGYDTECVRVNISSYVAEYAVCVPKGKSLKNSVPIPLTELMEQKGVPLFDKAGKREGKNLGGAGLPANREENMLGIYEIMDKGKTLPAAFDWRTNNAHAYIGAIRDQGGCGSCYAFAAAASAEGTYNWASGRYDGSCIDFSESFIIWCLGRLSQYSSHFYGCAGADYDYAELTALTAEGVCLESAFPYTESDPGSCAHWSDPVTVFSAWHRVPCGDVEAIKTAIMTYGIVDAAVLAGGSFQAYSSGIYADTYTNCYETPCYYTPVNHAIALVGWDDNPPEGGGGCWILRNSWNTDWGENGYMRIRYTSAAVACEACYLVYLGTNTHTLSVSSAYGGAYPAVGVTTNNDGALIACYITNSPLINGTTQFVCTGWTGSGSVPATGNDTNTGTLTLTNDSSIVWQWRTNFYLSLNTAGNGSVDVASGWKGLGSNVAVTATPASSYGFAYWSGATGGCVIASNRITVVMDGARSITANFSSNSPAVSSGVCADYDGDGLADPAVYDEDTGTWRIKLSSAGYYLLVTTFNGLGGSGSASVSADYDGDAKADPAVYRAAAGAWIILPSSLNYCTILVLAQAFGGPAYSGMPADYDGDARADPGVYHREQGDWKVLLSSANYFPVEEFALLGGTGYFPVAADYDGDGKGDPAIYGENSGYWIFMLSSIGYLEIALAQTLGGTGYLPVPADYDGDGLADPAVRNEITNEWLVMLSSANYALVPLTLSFE